MISKKTLEAVEIGILTDEQLDEAIEHYTVLEDYLKCHGEVYRLVWKDVYFRLRELHGYKASRQKL